MQRLKCDVCGSHDINVKLDTKTIQHRPSAFETIVLRPLYFTYKLIFLPLNILLWMIFPKLKFLLYLGRESKKEFKRWKTVRVKLKVCNFCGNVSEIK